MTPPEPSAGPERRGGLARAVPPFATCPDRWDVGRRCELKERNVSFSFPVLHPAAWNIGVMAGAAAVKLDPESTPRMMSCVAE